MFLGLLVASQALLVACAAPPPATVASGPPSPLPSEVIAEGDWDDAEPAVRTAVRLEQMAIERKEAYRSAGEQADSVLVFSVRTARGDSGSVTMTRLGHNASGDLGNDSGKLLVTVSIGAIGSASAEGRLVRRIIDRLAELRGRDYAPITE